MVTVAWGYCVFSSRLWGAILWQSPTLCWTGLFMVSANSISAMPNTLNLFYSLRSFIINGYYHRDVRYAKLLETRIYAPITQHIRILFCLSAYLQDRDRSRSGDNRWQMVLRGDGVTQKGLIPSAFVSLSRTANDGLVLRHIRCSFCTNSRLQLLR